MKHTDATLGKLMLDLQEDIHECAKEHGWWDDSTIRVYNVADHNKPEKIALMHSELSEALDAIRCDKGKDKQCPGFTNEEVEFADTIIRILDYAEAYELDVIGAMMAKHEFNKSRPHKHGGKKF